MIYRRLFPADGGGALRRAFRIKRDVFQNRSEAVRSSKRMRPLTLFDFRSPHDAADATRSDISGKGGGWRISDDETIGGFSGGTLDFVSSLEKSKTKGKPSHEDVSGNSDESDDDFVPYLRFEGATDTTLPVADGRIRRSGFVAIKSPEFIFGSADLGDSYNALEIICRVDSRSYTFNLKVSSFMPDDLYQGFIRGAELPPLRSDCEWRTLILPFRSFVLTAFGRLREQQRELDGGIIIEHLGITLADGLDGDFIFDLARVRAVNFLKGRVIEGDDDDEVPSDYDIRMVEKRQELSNKFRY